MDFICRAISVKREGTENKYILNYLMTKIKSIEVLNTHKINKETQLFTVNSGMF